MHQILIVFGAAFVLALASTYVKWRPGLVRPGLWKLTRRDRRYYRLGPTPLFLVLPRRLF